MLAVNMASLIQVSGHPSLACWQISCLRSTHVVAGVNVSRPLTPPLIRDPTKGLVLLPPPITLSSAYCSLVFYSLVCHPIDEHHLSACVLSFVGTSAVSEMYDF